MWRNTVKLTESITAKQIMTIKFTYTQKERDNSLKVCYKKLLRSLYFRVDLLRINSVEFHKCLISEMQIKNSSSHDDFVPIFKNLDQYQDQQQLWNGNKVILIIINYERNRLKTNHFCNTRSSFNPLHRIIGHRGLFYRCQRPNYHMV